MFSKILIANRGEIACRVMRTAKHLGIRTVAVYSDADRHALHVSTADESVHIGGPAPADSYLQAQRVIQAAKDTGSQAIHPGYGFLSENAAFCRLCAENGLVFIGPPVGAIEAMGSKSAAKQIMEQADVPLLPGYHDSGHDEARLKQAADTMGYPVLLKAVAGGGGKGMRQVHSAAEFAEALGAAKREALSSFGNDDMLVEKYLEQARHVEVQVFCDSHGHGVYLFERDCSVQRRHQKIIEEAPAPNITDDLRAQLGEAALRAAAAVGYVGAGTVEFLLDPCGAFYFMEMNTRLQVEHPVTEMITGTDLVAWQLRVANGEPLPLTQDQLNINGHAIEARIYAEDPANEFLPAAGKLWWLTQPEQSEHVRVDTGVIVDDEVGVFYDPMIAKLIVWGEDREMALKRLEQALARYRIAGVVTNIDLLRRLTRDPSFQAAALRTDFIDQHREALFAPKADTLNHALALLGAYLCLTPRKINSTTAAIDPTSPWHRTDAWRSNAPSQWTHALIVDQAQHEVRLVSSQPGHFDVSVGDVSFSVTANIQGNTLSATIDGLQHKAEIADRWQDGYRALVLFASDQSVSATTAPLDLGDDTSATEGASFKAPMNGTLVALFAEPGQSVEAGATLAIMEAMKMEHAFKAPSRGTVTDVFYSVGDLVDGGADLLSLEVAQDQRSTG